MYNSLPKSVHGVTGRENFKDVSDSSNSKDRSAARLTSFVDGPLLLEVFGSQKFLKEFFKTENAESSINIFRYFVPEFYPSFSYKFIRESCSDSRDSKFGSISGGVAMDAAVFNEKVIEYVRQFVSLYLYIKIPKFIE